MAGKWVSPRMTLLKQEAERLGNPAQPNSAGSNSKLWRTQSIVTNNVDDVVDLAKSGSSVRFELLHRFGIIN